MLTQNFQQNIQNDTSFLENDGVTQLDQVRSYTVNTDLTYYLLGYIVTAWCLSKLGSK